MWPFSQHLSFGIIFRVSLTFLNWWTPPPDNWVWLRIVLGGFARVFYKMRGGIKWEPLQVSIPLGYIYVKLFSAVAAGDSVLADL